MCYVVKNERSGGEKWFKRWYISGVKGGDMRGGVKGGGMRNGMIKRA